MMHRLLLSLTLLLAIAMSAQGQCAFTLNPASAQFSESPNTGSFTVTANNSSCVRTATSNSSWLTVSFGQAGTGNGSVGYRVDANPTYATRTGTISVTGAIFTVTQAAPPCPALALTPTSQSVQPNGGSFTIAITSPCGWNASTTASWITLGAVSGTDSGVLAYTVAANNAGVARSGSIVINGTSFPVTQSALSCTFTVTPLTVSIAAAGGQGQVSVQASDSSCPWTAQNTATWISNVSPAAATGSGTLAYTVAANPAQQARSTTLTVAGKAVSVTQAAAAATIQFTAQSIVNAASFVNGPLAPGELFSIFGSGLGPAQAVGLQTTPDGKSVTTSLGGTQVLINGIAAPLTFVSSTQVNAIVPFELSGATTTQIVVSILGTASSAVSEPVGSASPAIFAASGGKGQGAILNQDNSANSTSNPAALGTVLQVFATGFGQTIPTGINGQIATTPASLPIQKVTATIGGIDAPVLYAGSAYGLVAGVMQVNLLITGGVTPGNSVPVVLNVGGANSAPGVTVAIR